MPQSKTITKRVPRRALMFAAEMIPVDSETPQRDADGVLQIPFTMTARTGGVAQHPFWGRCVHDFAGMQPAKPSLSVDYCHNPEDIIGFSSHNEVVDNVLQMSGSLVSLEPKDRAEEIYLKRKAGVPYETSILTEWDGLLVENISDGMTTEVNGQQIEGPLVVFRQWTLWGVAVTPYGSDGNTDIQFAAGVPGEVEVSFIEGSAMSTTTPAATDPKPAAKTGKEYMAKFGKDKGALWFAEGKSWEESLAQFEADTATDTEALKKENGELKATVSELQAKYDAMCKENETVKGENAGLKRGTDPVSGGNIPDGKTTPQVNAKFAHLSPGVARFASTIKLPGQPSSN